MGDAENQGATTRRSPRRWSVALIGGLRVGGPLRMGDRMIRVSAIGGVDLDLTDAEFTAPQLTIVKVALIGGLDLRVPAAARVTVHGLAIGGRRIDPAPPGVEVGEGPEIVVHAWGILGGVKVRRAAGTSGSA